MALEKEILTEIKKTNNLLEELIKVQRETLNFFVVMSEQELNESSINYEEYMEEIKKGGFYPPQG